jgi:glycosyltransferase involved in cell wall biosynthesis
MKTPKVSVLIPTYNYGHFLSEAIESVLAQTFADFELVIVDNHSTDNTNEVVKSYLHDKRVSYYMNEHNIGMVGNYNKCLSYAKADLIKFLNSDDKFHPSLLEKFLEVANNYPTVSLITANQELFGDQNRTFDLPYSGFHKGSYILHQTLMTYNWIGSPTSVMFAKSRVNSNFRSDLVYLMDWDMWLKLLSVGDCYILSERLVFSRLHATQMTAKLKADYSLVFEEYSFYKEIDEKHLYAIDSRLRHKKRKIKAASVASIAYKTLLHIRNRKKRSLFKKAFPIAVRENVLFDPIISFISS